MSRLVIMGSGETAPTMVKPHREILARCAGPAVMLDTTFGFQANADDLVAKTQAYFAASVGTAVDVARWRRADEPVLERERALALLGRAGWVFAGPGSPTYALRQWRDTPVPAAIADLVRRGGTLVVGSAAACTVGTVTVPVYEIYKAGEDPCWADGLGLLRQLAGLDVAVVPHYDNAEGGGYDTRFCYLGEQRLALLETMLDEGVGVLGVDEHTAVEFDLTVAVAGGDPGLVRVRVMGTGRMTARYRGRDTVYPSGSTLTLAELAEALAGHQVAATAKPGPDDRSEALPAESAAARAGATAGSGALSLATATESVRLRFEQSLADKDVEGCVAAVLDLEQAIVDWSTDTLQSDDGDRARQLLRSCVVRLGELAHVGTRDPHEQVGRYVEALLELRGRARAAKDYATSDLVRDRLVSAGVEVNDTPDGVTWSLKP
jgi:hypothetical protein